MALGSLAFIDPGVFALSKEGAISLQQTKLSSLIVYLHLRKHLNPRRQPFSPRDFPWLARRGKKVKAVSDCNKIKKRARLRNEDSNGNGNLYGLNLDGLFAHQGQRRFSAPLHYSSPLTQGQVVGLCVTCTYSFSSQSAKKHFILFFLISWWIVGGLFFDTVRSIHG